MSFTAFKHKLSGDIFYAFKGEEYKLPYLDSDDWMDVYTPLPPNPSVILGTRTWMAGMYLDSMKTMYELDRILNIEAEQEREDRAYQELIKNL